MANISGLLRTLGVPTEPSFYALPTVVSYGTTPLLDLLKAVAGSYVVLKLAAKESPRQAWRLFGWALPIVVFALLNYSLRSIGPIQSRIFYALYFLGAACLLLSLFDRANAREIPVGSQLLVATVLFFLTVEGAGYRGDLEAYDVMNAQPGIVLLLAPEAVPGGAKLGIPFSSVESDLTEPLNVVVVSEKMFYARIPFRGAATQAQNGVRLDWVPATTVAIPRDKVLGASRR